MLFPLASLPDGPQLETKKALILLDFQNDFVHPAGRLYADNINPFLPQLPNLVARFREKGEVVWTRTEFRDPRPTRSPETGGTVILLKQFLGALSDQNSHDYPSPAADDDTGYAPLEDAEPELEPDAEAFLASTLPKGTQRCCLPGTVGVNMPSALSALIDRQKDIVVVKSHYSAFADMSLVLQLRMRRVTDLYICGALSNISVYATVLDAVRHGFGVTIIEDCIGYRDDACHVSAMRQMADYMCAEGIDCQELMDDLAGLLGDVIKEENFTTKFQVDLSRSNLRERQSPSPQTSGRWPSREQRSHQKGVEAGGSIELAEPPNLNSQPRPQPQPLDNSDSPSSKGTRQRSATIESSPVRKRSTHEIDDDSEEYHDIKPILPTPSAYRRQSYDQAARPETRSKKIKHRVRRAVPRAHDSVEETGQVKGALSAQSFSTGDLPDSSSSRLSSAAVSGRQPQQDVMASPQPRAPNSLYPNKRLNKKSSQMILGPNDGIGDGTSKVIYNVLDDATAEDAFHTLRANVRWQKMYHRTGEVPRLVAVQGAVSTPSNVPNEKTNGGEKPGRYTISSSHDSSGQRRPLRARRREIKTYPIYRHPADESPVLLPFDPTVDALRRECEKHVGHPLNHVLIQHYRNSEDNISEHSDKTLDIVRGSNIVNLSLGAQRTMTLRAKKPVYLNKSSSESIDAGDNHTSRGGTQPVPTVNVRPAQRVYLPNASLFILSTSTNTKWLHSIRADKRPPAEKSKEELSFNSERISLTFRHIGTFITEVEEVIDGGDADSTLKQSQLIWGQGARNKSKEDASQVLVPRNVHPSNSNPLDSTTTTNDKSKNNFSSLLNTTEEEINAQAENMIIAFGKENHLGALNQDGGDDNNNSKDRGDGTGLTTTGKEHPTGEIFDWQEIYGQGFDVVNFEIVAATSPSSSTLPSVVPGTSGTVDVEKI